MSKTSPYCIVSRLFVYSSILAFATSSHFAVAADSQPTDMTDDMAQLDIQVGLEPGNIAPTFTATDLDGKTIDLQKIAGESKYILLDFWASYCGPCRAEFPHLRKLNADYKDRGLQIIGVCSDTDRDTAARAAEQAELNYPHVYHADQAQQSVTTLYQVTGIPQTYILDSNLRVVAKGLRGSSLEHRIEELFLDADLANLKPNDQVVVAKDKAPLKVINDVLAELPKGQQLKVVSTQGDWIWTYVDRDGKRTKGWINAKLIALANDSESPAQAKDEALDGHMSGSKADSAGNNVLLTSEQGSSEGKVKPAKSESPAPPAPATPEPADWELQNPDEMPRLFEFAGTRNLKSDLTDEAVGEIGRFKLTGTDMTCAAVAPDGRFVVSGGNDSVIRLWDAVTGREIRQFEGHEAKILTLAFSADGQHILSGSTDASVRLWDVESGSQLHSYTGHESDVISVAFAPGGRFATSTGRDNTLRMWKLPAATMHTQSENVPADHIVRRLIVDEPKQIAAAKVDPKTLDGEVKLNAAGHIVAIDFRTSRANNATLKQLCDLKHLETLYIYGPNITDAGLESLRGLTQLKHLWLTATNITDAGMRSLSGLGQLESLVLSHCDGVSDTGLAHIEKLTTLKDLWLNETHVTDRGLKHLAGMTDLEMLVLPGNDGITDDGLKHLSKLTNLRDLWLNGANVSDKGLTLVAQLDRLQFVDAGQTQITAMGAQQFHQQLPSCDLEF
ncbi:redoxin domain-containing protein [Symmachiella dynata]|uniref:redoxin domain-containing protein n=1 Tax=Symmachiella dynata TaxID=2527995 RepID=UPI0011A4ADB1|nr:redoxin domain-containing protein [Symmachiella dynata]